MWSYCMILDPNKLCKVFCNLYHSWWSPVVHLQILQTILGPFQRHGIAISNPQMSHVIPPKKHMPPGNGDTFRDSLVLRSMTNRKIQPHWVLVGKTIYTNMALGFVLWKRSRFLGHATVQSLGTKCRLQWGSNGSSGRKVVAGWPWTKKCRDIFTLGPHQSGSITST